MPPAARGALLKNVKHAPVRETSVKLFIIVKKSVVKELQVKITGKLQGVFHWLGSAYGPAFVDIPFFAPEFH